MLSLSTVLLASCTFASLASAVPYKNSRAFEYVKRQAASSTASNDLQVDLGYAIYQGYNNATQGLNIWKGIHYAEAPIGNLRWQPPQLPKTNRTAVQNATVFGSQCPQSLLAPYGGDACPGLANSTTLPQSCANSTYFKTSILGSEDCLFVNVYAPQNATNLPVLVWIHGGGYGAGNGQEDLSHIINANQNGFVGVSIQYRLGAFGFLSSDEVSRYGSPNAGIYDQHFSLQWVQSYISRFGGDPTRVTISGESAGGGSVMLLTMAYGGTQGDFLFQNTIAASPYLPMQYGYADWAPTQAYFAFATQAGNVGCFNGSSISANTTSIFACLVSKDTLILQQASAIVSASGLSGTWGFLPVTDGTLIQQLPSQQLLKQQVNGLRVLSGNNVNEGEPFTPQNIHTEADLVAWLHLTFPLFSAADISKILLYYPNVGNVSTSTTAPLYSTNGLTGLTAENQSDLANGPQQIANNIYSETTFMCPSYWLAGSQAQRGEDHASYKYQFSPPPSTHGADVAGYFGPTPTYLSPDFELAFMQIWGNFIINDDPSISNLVANGNSTGNSTAGNAAANWPQFSLAQPNMLNLNTTGGTAMRVNSTGSVDGFYIENVEPGLTSAFEIVDAYTWEGGRGFRCDFWLSMAQRVPE